MPRNTEHGFSLVELLITSLVLLVLLAGIATVFVTGVNYYGGEQRTAQMNGEARTALDIMAMEIAQAGARRDFNTTVSADLGSGSATSQPVSVDSSTGFQPGDSVTVDAGGPNQETVQLTAVGAGSISGIFQISHATGTAIRFYSMPYITGIVPPAGLLPNSSVSVTALNFYGDFYPDGNVYYVEYKYDSANSQITRSITPLSQASENPAEPFIRNVQNVAPFFTLYSDNEGAVTSVSVGLTVQNTWKNKTATGTTRIQARMGAPSVAAASVILTDNRLYGTAFPLPATPANVTAWSVP